MDIRILVGGEQTSGWLVDIHDGTYHGVYSPVAETPLEAIDAAIDLFMEQFKDSIMGEGKPAAMLAVSNQRTRVLIKAAGPAVITPPAPPAPPTLAPPLPPAETRVLIKAADASAA